MPSVRPFRCFNSRIIWVSLAIALLLIALAWLGRGMAPRSGARVAVALDDEPRDRGRLTERDRHPRARSGRHPAPEPGQGDEQERDGE